MNTQLKLGKHTFNSRLIVGTGKYPSLDAQRDAIAASGADLVTVAIRRVDLKAQTHYYLEDTKAPE